MEITNEIISPTKAVCNEILLFVLFYFTLLYFSIRNIRLTIYTEQVLYHQTLFTVPRAP